MRYFDKLLLIRYACFSLWAILLLSCSSWILFGSVAYWVRHGWLPPDTAGWAQAVGVFFTIVVAIAVPAFQSRKQHLDKRNDQVQARLDGVRAVNALLVHVEDGFIRVNDFYSPQPSSLGSLPLKSAADPLWSDLARASELVREISVVSLSNEMVSYMITIREVANYGDFLSKNQGAILLGNESVLAKNQVRNHLSKLRDIKKRLTDLERQISSASI